MSTVSLSDNPFKGLHYYSEDDSKLFFGREQETEDLLRLIKRDSLSVLFARSGLGKTSLLRAGVIPHLRKEDFLPVFVRVDYAAAALPPHRQIIGVVLAAAAAANIDVEQDDNTSTAAEQGRDTLWEFFHRYRFWGLRNDPIIPVLMLDQFEEAFTLGRSSPHTDEFLTQLADLAENRIPRSLQQRLEQSGERTAYDTRAQNYRVLLALREDYVPKLDALRSSMPAVMRNRYALTPLDSKRGVEVIRSAAERWISEPVAQQIVKIVAAEAENDTSILTSGGEIEPAHLSVMCDELFRHMVDLDRSEIDSDLVDKEQSNILDAFYQRSFEGLSPQTRVFVEDHLLTATGFRCSLPLAEVGRAKIALADLNKLVDSRLLRFEDRLGATHVELSHDLLTRIVQKSRDRRQTEAVKDAERLREADFKKQLSRTRCKTATASAAVAILLAIIAFYAYGWQIPYQSYCRGFSKRWGTIHPVGPLSATAIAHRSSTLRLTRLGRFGKPQTLEVIDANANLTNNNTISTLLDDETGATTAKEKPSRYEFVYDRQGRIVYEVAWDRFGRMVWGLVYAPHTETDAKPTDPTNGVIDGLQQLFTGNDDVSNQPRSAKAMFLGPDGFPQPQGHSRAEFVEIRYDSHGFETELRYFDREGKSMPGKDNAYGQHLEYDQQGRQIRITSLDRDGKPTNDKFGNASIELSYDSDGNAVEQLAYDAKNEPTLLKGGYYQSMQQFDKWGRQIESRFFDLSGNPTIDREQSGAHKIVFAYDDHGNTTSIKLYDTENQPIAAQAYYFDFFDFPAYERRVTYDARNRDKTVAYFDADGEPVIGPEGWHSYQNEYDDRGFVSMFRYFDAQGKPINTKSDGIHRWEYVNDAYGQIVEEQYFDAENKPVEKLYGDYHMIKNQYDKFGNLTVQTYFGVDDKPVADRSDGGHRFVKTFDRFRHPIRTEYFGVTGLAINNTLGFHRIESSYDDYGSKLDTRWFDKDKRACNGPNGVHHVVYTYDERGQLIRIADFDAKDQPATDNQGIHKSIYEYNSKRQQTLWQYFGLDDKPVENTYGDHRVLNKFDERGRLAGATRLRADGSANLDRDLGIATEELSYDKEGAWTELAFYDTAHRLVIGPYGYAKAGKLKEAGGRNTLIYYGVDDKPMFNPLVGYASNKTDPRRRGDTFESYYGPDGSLINGPEGYAEVRIHWSDEGKLLSRSYFGPDGAPVVGLGGYHREERDPKDLNTVRYFDSQNHELASLTNSIVPIIYIAEITGIKQPAARIGLQAGDILWGYGTWEFPAALAAERAKGTSTDALLNEITQTFFTERDRLSAESTALSVIRNGKLVEFSVPPLPKKKLEARLEDRAVPIATFDLWKTLTAREKDKLNR